jgi:hypothetical protein
MASELVNRKKVWGDEAKPDDAAWIEPLQKLLTEYSEERIKWLAVLAWDRMEHPWPSVIKSPAKLRQHFLTLKERSGVVDDENDDLVLATANGIINRIKVGSVPRRKRASDGRVTKGARILRPDPGDRVVSGAIAPKTTGLAARSPESETVATDRLVFGPRRSLDAISTAGEPALDREAWAATEVHKHSTYRCGHCGAEHPEPHAVYECIAAHVEAARQPELALAA